MPKKGKELMKLVTEFGKAVARQNPSSMEWLDKIESFAETLGCQTKK